MNSKARKNKSCEGARIVAALFAVVFLIAKAPAQPAAQPVENRFLFVFDTSSDMKSRLPAVQRTLDTLLASSIRGQIRAGNSVAAWTFGRELGAGHLVQPWVPEHAAKISANIFGFVSNQRYSKKTSFDALMRSLNRVVQNSDRLTVLIFCDGYGQMTGTPYDSDINRVFEQQRAERKKQKQPFILVLRSQLGNYTGCTMDSPPALANFPEFPPLPQPPMEITNTPSPPPRPTVEAPPLIVIGTKTGTNVQPPVSALPPAPTPALPPPAHALPPAAAAPPANAVTTVETNPPPLVATVTPTNEPMAATVNPAVPPAPVPTKATPPPPKQKSGLSTLKALMIGGVFLGMAGVLAVLMFGRARKADHGSLITRSMAKSGKPPMRK